MLRQFERSCQSAVEANRKTLFSILKTNAETEFGRIHDFARITADESGRRLSRCRAAEHVHRLPQSD